MILVTGGAGYIGSHVNKELNRLGFKTLVLDNLSRGHKSLVQWGEFIQGDLGDTQLLDHIFKKYDIQAVVHLAAFAYVGESVGSPEIYYYNNVALTLNLLQVMKKHSVDKIVFSSTCSTYGACVKDVIDESVPQSPMNPYAQSKYIVEQMLKDFRQAYGLNFVVFRYFNAAGASGDCTVGEWHEPETHLIPLVLDVALGRRERIEIFGSDYSTPDGSCIRDYIHVEDIASAHCIALKRMLSEKMGRFYNLGTSKGLSVLQVIDEVERVTGKKINRKTSDRRAGDPPKLVGSYELIHKEWGWSPERSGIDNIIQTAWTWHKKLWEEG